GDGLPESIGFWKARLAETSPELPVPVGLIYGPSGCGKSSLVRAGILPRLPAHVRPVYVEATAEDTEARLLAGLGRAFPGQPVGASLVETVAALRRGLSGGTKVVIVLDQ